VRRLILIATLALLVVPASAQRSMGRGGMGGHAGFASRGSTFGRSGGRFGHPSFSGSFGHRSFGNRFHHRNRFFRGAWGWGYGAYYAYPWWGDYGYDQDYVSDRNAAYDAAMYNQQAQIEQRLDRIADRVDALLDRLQSPYPQAAPQSQTTPNAEPSSTATLVFRDGHTEQIQNYAIVGQTLWAFGEEHARKIPLAEINPEATDKANEQRGVDLHLPKA
jgi:hypothetical protein